MWLSTTSTANIFFHFFNLKPLVLSYPNRQNSKCKGVQIPHTNRDVYSCRAEDFISRGYTQFALSKQSFLKSLFSSVSNSPHEIWPTASRSKFFKIEWPTVSVFSPKCVFLFSLVFFHTHFLTHKHTHTHTHLFLAHAFTYYCTLFKTFSKTKIQSRLRAKKSSRGVVDKMA